MRRPVVLLACISLAACGSRSATVTTAPGTAEQTHPVAHLRNVTIHETEFRLDPAQANAGDEGLVRIKIVNDGKLPHALSVDGPNGEVDFDGQVDPGHTGTLEVDLDQPGTYRMWCPIDGHRGKGMTGTITVGGTSPARAGETGAATSTVTTGTTTVPTQTQTVTRTQTTTSSTQTTSTGSGGSGY